MKAFLLPVKFYFAPIRFIVLGSAMKLPQQVRSQMEFGNEEDLVLSSGMVWWQPLLAIIATVVFAGVVLIIACGFLGDGGAVEQFILSRPKKAARFIIIAFCVNIAVYGLFSFLDFYDYNEMNPWTFLEPWATLDRVCSYVFAVAACPGTVPLAICDNFKIIPPPIIILFLLFIALGLFWALMVELFLMLIGYVRSPAPVEKIISN